MRKLFQANAVYVLIFQLMCAVAASATEEDSKTSSSSEMRVLFTGQLKGYFRIPDHQDGGKQLQCVPQFTPQGESPEALESDKQRKRWSLEANQFDKQRRTVPNAILLGAGDNFAPRYEARVLDPPPGAASSPVAKDQYAWYPKLPQNDTWRGTKTEVTANTWVPSERVNERDMPNFSRFLRSGWGFVDFDNVGCFLVQENYEAIVPGKHDFYFGAERLRELARFLAGAERPDQSGRHVQMLGANLVIETTWTDDHKPLPDIEYKLPFAPRWPTTFSSQKDLKAPTVVKPADGDNIYPWLPGATVKLADLKSKKLLERLRLKDGKDQAELAEYLASIKNDSGCQSDHECQSEFDTELNNLKRTVTEFANKEVAVCESTDKGKREGDPNQIALPGDNLCHDLSEIIRIKDKSVEYFYEFPKLASEKHFLLKPGENYGFCLMDDDTSKQHRALPIAENGNEETPYCQRFSIHRPFFSFRGKEPFQNGTPSLTDPGPFVYLPADKDKQKGRPTDVVIFGVVDPDLADYIGVLNLEWANKNDKDKDGLYKTATAIKDPAEALKEISDYFNWSYEKRCQGKKFKGISILLSGMNPQRAQVLAERLGRFDVVVTGADPDIASSKNHKTVNWTPLKSDQRESPAFLAVPPPYSVETREPKEQLQIGSLEINVPHEFAGTWTFDAGPLVPPPDNPTPVAISPATQFWSLVAATLAKHCIPAKAATLPLPTAKQEDQIQLLTLCAMQKELGADVVLLQKRDFYVEIPKDDGDIGDNTSASKLQKFLDRIIWKGDFLTLIYVPGSALIQVMELSKKFKAEDSSLLSLADERKRDLVALGMRYDADRSEYIIDDIPLDKNRLYAVGTSDYVGAGDTGFPDLAAAAVKPPQVPKNFPKDLETISSVVCRRMSGADCQPQIKRDTYIDALEMKPTDNRQGQTSSQQFRSWGIFHRTHRVPGEKPAQTAATETEDKVQHRGLGSVRINPPDPSLFALDNASLSFNHVNHEFSDANLPNTFSGTPVTQLSTPRSHSFGFDVLPRYAYSWEHVELFEAQEMRYNVQYTGQLKANSSRVINQKENLWSTDTGVKFHLPNRKLWRVEPTLTFHTETQLWNPLRDSIESLANSNKPPVTQPFDRSRRYLLLPRTGARFMDRESWIEVGLESGGELNAVRLVTAQVPPPGSGTETIVQRPNIRVSGVYWNWHTIVPFSSSISWQVDGKGDYFFNGHDDNPTDTHFLSDSETALNFKVWPSLSFAPTYEIFLYSNKVQNIWFWQGQASLKMKMHFDFWNHRQWFPKQIQYSPTNTK